MRNENQKEIMKILNEVSETLNATSNTLCYNKIEDVKALFKLEFEQKSSYIEEGRIVEKDGKLFDNALQKEFDPSKIDIIKTKFPTASGELIDLKTIKKAKQISYLTSGQCLIFDEFGQQIPELQIHFSNGQKNQFIFELVAHACEKFSIGKFREWMQEVDKEDFLTLTRLKNH